MHSFSMTELSSSQRTADFEDRYGTVWWIQCQKEIHRFLYISECHSDFPHLTLEYKPHHISKLWCVYLILVALLQSNIYWLSIYYIPRITLNNLHVFAPSRKTDWIKWCSYKRWPIPGILVTNIWTPELCWCCRPCDQMLGNVWGYLILGSTVYFYFRLLGVLIRFSYAYHRLKNNFLSTR